MPTEKDVKTEHFRKRLTESMVVVETDRADSGLCTLSFQSELHPDRHIWIDTDLSGEGVLDLEDWRDDTQWDNSVAHASSQDISLLADIANAWLDGKPLSECKKIGRRTVTWQ